MLLQLNHIAKQYDSPDDVAGVSVLKDISLNVQHGESVAIVGPSGSGKSTLLNIIGTLDRPTSGNLQFDGHNLLELSDTELAKIRNKHIGFVFQLHHLLPQCSVIENVLIPTIPQGTAKNSDRFEYANQLLEQVGLRHRINYKPGQLSGGECQRVAVVRALINEPKMLLADEPTGSLDQHSSEQLGDLLVQLNQEKKVTLIVVTHSAALASKMSKKYELRSGVLIE